MTREQLYKAMLNAAHIEVEHNGYRFSSEAESQLRELLTTAVNRLTFAELTNTVLTTRAQLNTKEFVNRLCEKHRREQSGIIVENRTFTAARFTICPIWPIC